jgi:hypothetical protein
LQEVFAHPTVAAVAVAIEVERSAQQVLASAADDPSGLQEMAEF